MLQSTTTLATAVVELVLVGVATLPAVWRISKRFSNRTKQYSELLPVLYEDEDGVASNETQAAFTDKYQRISIILLAVLGLVVSLALAILATVRPELSLPVEQWLQFAVWFFILAQATILNLEPQPTRRSTLGSHGGLSCIFLIAAICIENLSFRSTRSVRKPHNVHLTLTLVQIGVGLALGGLFVSLPRRPAVFRGEKVVDGQYTVSILGRLAFSWAGPLLNEVAKHKTLEIDDLPELDHYTRAHNLRERFDNVGKTKRFWHAIFFSHIAAFITQWVLVTITSITNFLPQIALLKILRVLEARGAGQTVAVEAWGWVIGLGVSIVVSSWLEAWQFFIILSRLGVPVYEQLSAVIFSKAMRKKDVKGVHKTKDKNEDSNGQTIVSLGSGPQEEDSASTANDDDEDEIQKSKQSTINLVGVDSKRVADFATFNYIFLGVAVKLLMAVVLLVNLIGWIPMLSGFLVSALVTPLNFWAANVYAAAQGDLMKVRDQKMAVVTEALQGIRQIKFSALEGQWHRKIGDIRENELKTQWKVFRFDTGLISIWILGPIMLSAVSLAVYAILNKDLSASVAFTTISVFGSIEMTLAIIPEFITEYLDAKVSAERIEKYLISPEKHDSTVEAPSIAYENALIAWPADEPEDVEHRFQLHNITLEFPKGELSVISGKTGSGKSLLLASILGESDVLGGVVKVPRAPPLHERYDDLATRDNWIIDSAIAFVAQIPWIENASIRDNILFGLPYDSERYRKVLHVCALEKDLKMLPDGELTDIGANGINLSGGQKWRVSFARALYSRAGILVMDDIFGAVDAHVGRHLYEEALTGELGRGRTRILVTHHVALCLPRTRYSVLLGEGCVQYAGFVEDLRQTGALTAILSQDADIQEEEEQNEQENALIVDDGGGLQKFLTTASARTRRKSMVDNTEHQSNQKIQPRKFTEVENRETGSIKRKVYLEYLETSGGATFWGVVMAFFAGYIGLILARSWWVSVWTRSYRTESLHANLFAIQSMIHHAVSEVKVAVASNELWYYLGIYVALSIVTCIIGTTRYFLVFLGSIRASRQLFEKLTFAVLRAKLRWLDTVPVGRVLNRFTADFNMIDSRIANDFGFMLYNLLEVLGVIVAGIFVSPWMILFAVVLLIICMRYALRYLTGAREVKRLESNAKSPVFEQFGSALSGVGTIRAFGKGDTYITRMYKKIDTHARAYWHLWLFNRWLGFRLNMVGAGFATITAALIVSIKSIDASLAGFALSFALQYTDALVWALRQYANVELDMNAVERVVEYSNIATESQAGDPVPAAWPTEGRLEIAGLVVGYADDLPPVLKGLSFSVQKNQRVGVVGRTGAGKSSLTLALFRFLEAREGVILIDGVDISKITLHDLRSRLAIIPQDPVLFSGTVRSNLDAFDEHDDPELRDALARVHLIPSSANTANASAEASGSATPVIGGDLNKNIFRSLNSKISEGGLNLSQGQRQLLCLARAIVSRPKIMVLDEATSAVDMATDALIQRSIREEFTDSTLIVIAHRLSTIADFDRILVMGDGKVLEYDAPERLMEKEDGEFRKMVEDSGERDVLEDIIRGRSKP